MSNPSPTDFLIVKDIFLDLFTPGQVTVSWIIEDTFLDPSLFSFYVERSGSPEGPFTILNNTGLKAFEFIDEDARLFAKNWHVYYRILTVRDADNETTITDPKTFYGTPDLIGLEIARRAKLLLDTFVGKPCVLYKRKHWGERCTVCWDSRLRRRLRSQCEACFDTGYNKGYWDPIDIRVNFSPSEEMIRLTPWGLTEPGATSAWTGNYPLIEPMDIIIERMRNRRWAVKQTQNTEKRRVPIRQMLRLEDLEKSRIEFKLPVDIQN